MLKINDWLTEAETRLICRWWSQCNFALFLSLLTDFSIVLLFLLSLLLLSLSLLEAWDSTCSPFRFERQSSSSRWEQPYMPSQGGLLSLPAQSQECGGDKRRQAATQGELDRAVKVLQANSRTSIFSFVWGQTGGTLLESYKMTFCGLLASCQNQTPCEWHVSVGPALMSQPYGAGQRPISWDKSEGVDAVD